MSAPALDKRADLYRLIPNPNAGQAQQPNQIVARVLTFQCAIEPLSEFDADVPYARSSTHAVYAPSWLQLRKDDEIRWGRRLPDVFGTVQPWVYTVNGRQLSTQAIGLVLYYATEKD